MDWVDFIYNCVLWLFWLYILPMLIVIIWNETMGDEWETDNPFANILTCGAIIFVILMTIYEMIVEIFKEKFKHER